MAKRASKGDISECRCREKREDVARICSFAAFNVPVACIKIPLIILSPWLDATPRQPARRFYSRRSSPHWKQPSVSACRLKDRISNPSPSKKRWKVVKNFYLSRLSPSSWKQSLIIPSRWADRIDWVVRPELSKQTILFRFSSIWKERVRSSLANFVTQSRGKTIFHKKLWGISANDH